MAVFKTVYTALSLSALLLVAVSADASPVKPRQEMTSAQYKARLDKNVKRVKSPAELRKDGFKVTGTNKDFVAQKTVESNGTTTEILIEDDFLGKRFESKKTLANGEVRLERAGAYHSGYGHQGLSRRTFVRNGLKITREYSKSDGFTEKTALRYLVELTPGFDGKRLSFLEQGNGVWTVEFKHDGNGTSSWDLISGQNIGVQTLAASIREDKTATPSEKQLLKYLDYAMLRSSLKLK